jgi:hypothetical protein
MAIAALENVGPYRIIRPIASGGMGAVYLAEHTNLHREVALKTLKSELSNDDEFISRFQREARVASQIEHPNVLKIFDLGFDAEHKLHYMAMDYVPNGTLDGRLKTLRSENRTMAEREALMITRGVAAGLAAAHAKGLVHRDIKPSNIMLREDGSPLLADFGIVLASEATKLTSTGRVFGTPLYMSPEQALGKTVDARSDIYTLGIMLFEMLSGRPPFRADTPIALIQKHLKEPLPAITVTGRAISFPTRRLIERACAKQPGDRFRNAGEFERAITHILGESSASTLGRVAAQLSLLRPTRDDRSVRAAAATGGFALRTLRVLALGALVASIVIAAAAIYGGAFLTERVIAAIPVNARAESGEQKIPLTLVRELVANRLKNDTRGWISLNALDVVEANRLKLSLKAGPASIDLMALLTARDGAPNVALFASDGAELPVLGSLYSASVSNGLATAWQNNSLRLESLKVGADAFVFRISGGTSAAGAAQAAATLAAPFGTAKVERALPQTQESVLRNSFTLATPAPANTRLRGVEQEGRLTARFPTVLVRVYPDERSPVLYNAVIDMPLTWIGEYGDFLLARFVGAVDDPYKVQEGWIARSDLATGPESLRDLNPEQIYWPPEIDVVAKRGIGRFSNPNAGQILFEPILDLAAQETNSATAASAMRFSFRFAITETAPVTGPSHTGLVIDNGITAREGGRRLYISRDASNWVLSVLAPEVTEPAVLWRGPIQDAEAIASLEVSGRRDVLILREGLVEQVRINLPAGFFERNKTPRAVVMMMPGATIQFSRLTIESMPQPRWSVPAPTATLRVPARSTVRPARQTPAPRATATP